MHFPNSSSPNLEISPALRPIRTAATATLASAPATCRSKYLDVPQGAWGDGVELDHWFTECYDVQHSYFPIRPLPFFYTVPE